MDDDSIWGYSTFLSHEKYKTWAKTHGDVFMLKATVTLHQQVNSTTEDGWTRYVFVGFGF